MPKENLEILYGAKTYESDKEKEKQSGPWERISEEVIKRFPNDRKNEAMEILDSIKDDMKKTWAEQVKSGNCLDDPAEQEKLWVEGLKMKVEDKLHREKMAA